MREGFGTDIFFDLPGGGAKAVVVDPGACNFERALFIVRFFVAVTEVVFIDDSEDGRDDELEITHGGEAEVVDISGIGDAIGPAEVKDLAIHGQRCDICEKRAGRRTLGKMPTERGQASKEVADLLGESEPAKSIINHPVGDIVEIGSEVRMEFIAFALVVFGVGNVSPPQNATLNVLG